MAEFKCGSCNNEWASRHPQAQQRPETCHRCHKRNIASMDHMGILLITPPPTTAVARVRKQHDARREYEIATTGWSSICREANASDDEAD